MRRVLVLAALALAGCSPGPPPKVSYVQVDKPVAVACVPIGTATAAPRVHTPAELAAAPDGPTRYIMTAADYLALYGWSLGAAPVLTACATAAPPPHRPVIRDSWRTEPSGISG